MPGEVRRLDLLLWDLSALRDYGFRFRQEYRYSDATHRVVADNRLKAPKAHLERFGAMRVCPRCRRRISCRAWRSSSPMSPNCMPAISFLPIPGAAAGRWVADRAGAAGIQLKELDAADQPEGALLRTFDPGGCPAPPGPAAGALLRRCPGALERFEQETPVVTVCKNLVFDSAHFITDHPAKCSNLHGGRYALNVKVRGRIDPVTGCVIDYGYLKRVVSRRVIDRFDHANLNYTAPELAWRSSTEMLVRLHLGAADRLSARAQSSWSSMRPPSPGATIGGRAWRSSSAAGSDPVLELFPAGSLDASRCGS